MGLLRASKSVHSPHLLRRRYPDIYILYNFRVVINKALSTYLSRHPETWWKSYVPVFSKAPLPFRLEPSNASITSWRQKLVVVPSNSLILAQWIKIIYIFDTIYPSDRYRSSPLSQVTWKPVSCVITWWVMDCRCGCI